MNDRSSHKIVTRALDEAKKRGLEIPHGIVDIGAAEGSYTSTSLGLIEQGWKAWLFEPQPNNFRDLQNLHSKRKDQVECFNAAVCERTGTCLIHTHKNDLAHPTGGGHGYSILDYATSGKTVEVICYAGYHLPVMIDFTKVGIMTLDTEGFDYRILESFFSIENGPKPPIVISEKSDNFGPGTENDQANKVKLMQEIGYEYVVKNGPDDVFIFTGKQE